LKNIKLIQVSTMTQKETKSQGKSLSYIAAKSCLLMAF